MRLLWQPRNALLLQFCIIAVINNHWLTRVIFPKGIGTMDASCSTCSGPMDLMDAHIYCPGCLGIDHLKEALTDPCPECSLMSLEIRQQRLAKFEPGSEDCLTRVKTRTQTGSKCSASKTEGPPKKKLAPTAALSHQVVELANAVQGIQAFFG